jgi:predicted XRE-type DNA-binding protein
VEALEDADDLVLRAELMRKIGAIIEAKQLTQVEAGQLVGMDQPRISALMRGEDYKVLDGSPNHRALNDLGHDIELRIRPAMRPKGVVKIVGGKSSHSTKTDKRHQAT